MPATPHIETHFLASESVRDAVIGMADGLTVPFALAAGLSAAVVSTEVIVTAGLAEVVAGAIAMGLGGYLAARTDAEHCAAEENRENSDVDHLREKEIEEVETILREYGLEAKVLQNVVNAVAVARPEARSDQRRHHRRVLHRWRTNPADPLYARAHYHDGP